jgi:hypothetical protein
MECIVAIDPEIREGSCDQDQAVRVFGPLKEGEGSTVILELEKMPENAGLIFHVKTIEKVIIYVEGRPQPEIEDDE